MHLWASLVPPRRGGATCRVWREQHGGSAVGAWGQAPELRGQGQDQPAIREKGAAGFVSGPGPHHAEAMGALRGQLST